MRLAAEVIRTNRNLRLIGQIHGRAHRAIYDDRSFRLALDEAVTIAGVAAPADLVQTLIGLIDLQLGKVLSDEGLPGRDDILDQFIRGILQDAQIASILK